MTENEQKLQIDDDWKTEAAAEKDRLAKALEENQGQPSSLPQASLMEIIQLFAMQAMVGLGGMKSPDGKHIPPNLDMAKHHIDLLDVLEMKTKGQLSAEEQKALDTTLHQLRLAYVEVVHGASPEAPMT